MARLSQTMIAAVCLTGVLVLLGWVFDITFLKSVIPGLVAMNPATAIGFILAATAVFLIRDEPVPATRRRAAQLCAGALMLLGISVLLRYLAGWQDGIDQLLFREKLARAAELGHRNRMAPNTALMFVLVGVSLLGLDHRSSAVRKWAEALCLTAGLLAFLALTGYAYGASRLYGVPSFIPIAFNTALAFAALTAAILSARPDRGLTALLRSQSPGGMLLRVLLPTSFVLPFILGLLRLEGERRGFYDLAGGVALYATLTTLCLAGLVWWSAASLDRADAARRNAEQAVREANQDLEARVAARTRELQIEIKERAEAEAALRAQKEFLRKVVDANPQLVFIKDWDGRFLLANQPVADLYGTTPGELEGKCDADFNPNRTEVESYLRADREVMQSERTLHIAEESVTHPRSGETRWFQTVKVPLTGPDGRSRQVLGVSTDITDRRRADELFRRTADQLEALVQAAPVAILGIDIHGNVTHWYGGAETMFGWTAEEAIGRPLMNVPPDKQEESQALRSRILRGGSVAGLETRRMRKDGSPIEVSISTAPLHDEVGRIVGIIGVYQDITERRLMAEQRQAREAADAANGAKSNFLANMSHELRTPLNAIIGFSELLEDRTFGELNDRQHRYVTNVLSSGRHLLQLVNDILDLAKIEAGRLVLEPESIDLVTLLRDMERGIEPLAATKQQKFETQLAENLPRLTADRAKIKQIMYNLLSNAIKFTKEGGRIGMRATMVPNRDGGDEFQIVVWDTGVGIEPEDLKRIFLEFEQVDSSYVRQQEGTGLGLALTKRLVEAHGGRIDVESTVGKGSTFTVHFPLVSAVPAAEPRPSGPRRVAGQGQEPLVLVVEGDTTARELLSHYLVEHGYRVAHAETAVAALELARTLHPDAISLDIFLPDENGLKLLSKLRGDPLTQDIPVVVVSIIDDRDAGLNAGAAAWLVKPVQRQHFIEVLDRLVPAGSANGRRVALVVDDEPEAVELATDILRGRGFEVLQAFGGNEGLALAIDHAPAVIILDLNMPDVTGFTVAQQLRAHPRTRNTPIVVCTAMDLTAAQREELMRHVQTVVPKGGAERIIEALERLGLTPRRSS